MAKRTRHDRVLIPGPLIEASRNYRDALNAVHRELNPLCSTYASASKVTSAIDDLMAEVTGQRDLFHTAAHSS